MNRERIGHLLKAAFPPVGEGAEPIRDLWPELRRVIAERESSEAQASVPPWFDWALGGAVALFALAFPAAVPMLLYYL